MAGSCDVNARQRPDLVPESGWKHRPALEPFDLAPHGGRIGTPVRAKWGNSKAATRPGFRPLDVGLQREVAAVRSALTAPIQSSREDIGASAV